MQNELYILVWLYSVYAVWNYPPDDEFYLTVPYIVFGHIVIDSFLTKKTDMLIHHGLVIGITSYQIIHQRNNPTSIHIIYYLLRTELSTIFLVVKEMAHKWQLSKREITANNILFVVFFIKLRILDFFKNIIINEQAFRQIMEAPNFLWISLPVYGLFLLNVYWMTQIGYIAYKKMNKLFLPYYNQRHQRPVIYM